MATVLSWLLLLCLLLPVSASARSFPSTPDALLDTQERWGAAATGYVAMGCVPSVSGGMTLSLPPCRAFALDASDPPALKGFEEPGTRTLTLAGAGPFWLAGRWHPGVTPAGWTCQPGTHYCWLQSATEPVWPSGTVRLAVATVTTGALTSVQVLAATTPVAGDEMDGTIYATQYGLRCDGVSDNSAALESAVAHAQLTGARLVLPATGGTSTCRFSRTLRITANLWLIGAGAHSGGSGFDPATILEYTGTGIGIEVTGAAAGASVLEGFELRQAGTGTIGMSIDGPQGVKVQDVSLTNPSLEAPGRWSQYALVIGLTLNTTSTILERVVVRGAAPVGIVVNWAQSYTRIVLSRSTHNTVAQVQLGLGNTAVATHIIASDFSAQDYSTGILVQRVEGLWIDNSYCEVSGGVGVDIPATAERTDAIYIQRSRFSLFAAAPIGVRVNHADADVTVSDNWFLYADNVPTPTLVQNTLARVVRMHGNFFKGGATQITSYANAIVTENNADSPGFVDDFRPAVRCTKGEYGSNVDAGETNFPSCLIDANKLWRQAMSGMRLTLSGKTATNTNNKRVKVYLNTTQVFDSGSGPANNKDWLVRCTGVRSETAQGMYIACEGLWNDSPVPVSVNPGITLPFTAPITVQPTGQGSVSADVTQLFLVVEIWP